MLPFKRILCPTDFSDPSYVALDAAKELAVEFSSELLLVHVVGPVPMVVSPEAAGAFNVSLYQEQLRVSAENSLQEICQQVLAESISVRPVVVHGNAADEIVRIASDEGIDVIVIATHGRTGFRRFIFGSVAERVVRTASCPVLTVQPDMDTEEGAGQ